MSPGAPMAPGADHNEQSVPEQGASEGQENINYDFLLNDEEQNRGTIRYTERLFTSLGITDDDQLWLLARRIHEYPPLRKPMHHSWHKEFKAVCHRLGREQTETGSSVGDFLLHALPRLGLAREIQLSSGKNVPSDVRQKHRHRLAAYPGPQIDELLAEVKAIGCKYYEETAPPDTRGTTLPARDAVAYGLAVLRTRYPPHGYDPTENGAGDADEPFCVDDGGAALERRTRECLEMDRAKWAYQSFDKLAAVRHPESVGDNDTLGVHPLTSGVYRAMRDRHAGPELASDMSNVSPHSRTVPQPGRITVPRDMIIKTVKKLPKTKAAGISGWDVDMLQVAVQTEGFVDYMQRLVVLLANGNVQGRLLFAINLQPLRKADGSIFDVCVTELIYRVAVRLAIRLLHPDWKEKLPRPQFGLGTRDGPAPVIRAVELAMLREDPDYSEYTEVTTLNFLDAYGGMDRDLIARYVRQYAPRMYKLLLGVYGQPATLVMSGKLRHRYGDRFADRAPDRLEEFLDAFMYLSTPDADRDATARYLADFMFGEKRWISAELLSCQGTHRGDPLATVLVSVVISAFSEALQQRLGPAHLVLAYMDSIVVLSRADPSLPHTTGQHVLTTAAEVGTEWRGRAPLGFVVDTAKSRVYSRADAMHGDGIPLFGTIVGNAEASRRLAEKQSARLPPNCERSMRWQRWTLTVSSRSS